MKYGTESCCVFPLPEFSFQGEGGEFSFDYTGEGFTTIAWDFGDDTGTSTIEDPDHSYTEDGDYVVCVTVTNDCGSQQYCRQVTAAGTAGTSDRALEQLKAYPNPVNNLLTISSNSILSYVLYSVPGAKIQDGSLFTGQQQIDMRSLPSGFYILTLKNGQGEQKTIKVVKE
jgi:FOG: PKD repeat